MTFKAIIFDMDGLLVDSEIVWFDAETRIIESRGHKYTEEVREQIVGMRMDEFMAKLHNIYQFDDTVEQITEELVALMLKLIPETVKAQPGAEEILAYVREQNIPCAIASSSPVAIIDATVKAQGWEDLFQVRCSADDEQYGKPAPDVYLTAARKLGVAPEECLALEDSPNGSRAAVAAGLTCYAVPDLSHTSFEAFEGITPHVFGSLHDVLDQLQTMVRT